MRLAPLCLLAILPACASEREGWATRGHYEILYDSPSVQIRRGGQKIDPETGEFVITWVGARTLDTFPELVACELTVFEDRDGDDAPGVGEVLSMRESREMTQKLLFSDVRVRPRSSNRLRARMVASTERERCVVSWVVDPD